MLLSGPADEAAIEAGLERELGYEVRTFLRTRDELAAVVSPFSADEHASHGKLQVTFLKSAPDQATTRAALAFGSDDDLLAIRGRELYWLPRAGISTSDLDHNGLNKVLGLGTTRTMGTVENIRKKLG